MNVPKEIAFKELSTEEKFDKAVPGYMRRIRSLYEALYRRYGEEGLDLIREVSREYGTAVGKNVNKKGDLKGIAEVGGYLLKVFDVVSDDWEVAEFSDERLIIAVHRCPYPFKDDEVCRAHTCMEQALVAALDPSLDYYIGRSIPQGDPFCEHILARKDST